jgi:2-polyprenyl-6-methoxyphenol hydroxylase-like FAD-dependent oxidoreductase
MGRLVEGTIKRDERIKALVATIGACPAGLVFGHLLKAEGIDRAVIKRRVQDYVLSRIRAGVL